MLFQKKSINFENECPTELVKENCKRAQTQLHLSIIYYFGVGCK